MIVEFENTRPLGAALLTVELFPSEKLHVVAPQVVLDFFPLVVAPEGAVGAVVGFSLLGAVELLVDLEPLQGLENPTARLALEDGFPGVVLHHVVGEFGARVGGEAAVGAVVPRLTTRAQLQVFGQRVLRDEYAGTYDARKSYLVRRDEF